MAHVVRISSRMPGRRRAGIAHPKGPVDHPIERFTDAQLAALKADPELAVSELADAPPSEFGDPSPAADADGQGATDVPIAPASEQKSRKPAGRRKDH